MPSSPVKSNGASLRSLGFVYSGASLSRDGTTIGEAVVRDSVLFRAKLSSLD